MFALRTDATLRWVKGPKVLDIGCTGHVVEIGSPYWLHGRLREKFSSVTGVDICAENVEMLRNHGLQDVHVQSAESFDLSQRFDTIVAGELIEHLSNPGLFLQQARQHLGDQGRLVVTTPNPFSIAYLLYAIFKFPRTCQNPQHTCWFCPRTMIELAERWGFRVLHFELIDDYRPDDPSFLYRLFGKLMMVFGPVIPKRMKKTMLFVLAPDADGHGVLKRQLPGE